MLSRASEVGHTRLWQGFGKACDESVKLVPVGIPEPTVVNAARVGVLGKGAVY